MSHVCLNQKANSQLHHLALSSSSVGNWLISKKNREIVNYPEYRGEKCFFFFSIKIWNKIQKKKKIWVILLYWNNPTMLFCGFYIIFKHITWVLKFKKKKEKKKKDNIVNPLCTWYTCINKQTIPNLNKKNYFGKRLITIKINYKCIYI